MRGKKKVFKKLFKFYSLFSGFLINFEVFIFFLGRFKCIHVFLNEELGFGEFEKMDLLRDILQRFLSLNLTFD